MTETVPLCLLTPVAITFGSATGAAPPRRLLLTAAEGVFNRRDESFAGATGTAVSGRGGEKPPSVKRIRIIDRFSR